MTQLIHQRPSERAELASLFKAGKSVLMLAPRRIGKTWLLDRVAEDMAQDNWLCIRMDAQGARDEGDFLRRLTMAIQDDQKAHEVVLINVMQRVKQFAGGFTGDTILRAIGQVDHRQLLEALVEGLNKRPEPTLILIDELALFVLAEATKKPESARSLLYHLRNLRQSYPKVCWFMTGSIGLDEVGRRHDMQGALLGMEIFPINPFTPDEARSFIEELFSKKITRPFTFEQGAFERLVAELGWLSPYHLEEVVKKIAQKLGDGHTAQVANVEEGFEALLAPQQRMHFSGWKEHVTKNFKPEDVPRLLAILEIASQNADGETIETYLTHLSNTAPAPSLRQVKDWLIALQSDAFLTKKEERWMFLSGLLRRYWREYEA